jgi:hypothetical protein
VMLLAAETLTPPPAITPREVIFPLCTAPTLLVRSIAPPVLLEDESMSLLQCY